MAEWIAHLSKIAHIAARCGYMGMYGGRLTKMAPMFSIANIVICHLGRSLYALVPIG